MTQGRIARVAIAVMLLTTGCHDCGSTPCDTTADCPDDGLFCTTEICVPGRRRGTCESVAACGAGTVCDEASRTCRSCGGISCSTVDAGPDAEPLCSDLVPGTACSGSRSCSSQCQQELTTEWSGTTTADGLPGRSLPLPLFPGGYCSVSCDASRLNDECEPCAVCNGDALAGGSRLPLYAYGTVYDVSDGVCRDRCTPSRTGTGCARAGYTCDLETSTCMEACVDDRQCQIAFGDFDGDGSYEFLDRGPDYPGYCDATTGRCRTRGTPGAHVGDRCTVDGDCEDDGRCLHRPGSAEGICTRPGCRAPGFECGPGAACDVRNVGRETSGCMLTCRVGIEDGTPAMRGSRTGGNPDCGPGLACAWNGVAEPGDDRTGSCVLGQYNDLTAPNVGAPCQSASDCDSPFGYGTCLFSEVTDLASGICTVRHCGTFLDAAGETTDGLLPNVEIASAICDPARGEVCMNLASRRASPQTYCVKRCEDASECAPGYACAELLGGSARFCWPYCYDASECRAGARCETSFGGPCGAEDDYCYCSDRMPR